jgi:hypothetical protein
MGGRAAFAAAGVAAGLIAGGGALALAAQGARTVSACVHHKGGGLYEAKKCARHDGKLTWSKVGPRGLTGPAGNNGTNGTNGTDGTNGANASTYSLTLAANASSDDIAPLGSTADLYGLCNSSSPDRLILLGVTASGPWSIAGSYSKFQFTGNSVTLAYGGGGLTGTTYAIGNQVSSGSATVLEDSALLADTGIFSGSAEVTIGSGASATSYTVNFQDETLPGSPGSCQYVVSVSAAS